VVTAFQNDILKHNVVNEKTEENTKPIISNSGSEFERLKEEYDLAKDQINFLNSVIVDMQHKNEALLCKVQVLEMGIPSQEADDYNRLVTCDSLLCIHMKTYTIHKRI
jgi:hypothetical protein